MMHIICYYQFDNNVECIKWNALDWWGFECYIIEHPKYMLASMAELFCYLEFNQAYFVYII